MSLGRSLKRLKGSARHFALNDDTPYGGNKRKAKNKKAYKHAMTRRDRLESKRLEQGIGHKCDPDPREIS